MADGEITRERQPLVVRSMTWLNPARAWFIAGALISLLGFALPWFRISTNYLWWYGGWDMLTTNAPDLWWIGLIFLGYAVLLLASYWLLGRGPGGAVAVLALAVGVALSTLIVVAFAVADAVGDQGRVYFLDMHLGLFLMVPGHAVMVAAASACLMLQFIATALAPGSRDDFAVGQARSA